MINEDDGEGDEDEIKDKGNDTANNEIYVVIYRWI